MNTNSDNGNPVKSSINVPMADLPANHLALKSELTAAFEQVLEKSIFGLGPNVSELEKDVASLCGTSYGLGVNSGTDALLLALKALGIGPGDEVITTPFTFVATVETVCLAGATPVFADIDLDTFNMDPDKTKAKITPKTKAIMPVHLFGQMAAMDRFSELAVEHGIPLIGDAAQAISATFQDKPIGKWSDITTISFFPTKNLGACGDGGMVLTDSPDYAEKIKLFRFHGSGGGYYYKEVGYCSRLDEIQAAFLRVKLNHLEAWTKARRVNAGRYMEKLGDLDKHIVMPATLPGNYHIYNQFVIRVLDGKRDALQKHLMSYNVQSAIYYPLSLHVQDAYAYLGYKEGDLPNSEQATREVLALPIHQNLTQEQVDHAIYAVREFYK